MEGGRTLRNKTRLFSLGLSNEIVDQINQMIDKGSRLKENFSTLMKGDRILASDIIFIHAENKSVINLYSKYSSMLTAVPVFVHQKGSEEYLQDTIFEKYPDAKTLALPLTIGILAETLLDIISSKKMSVQVEQVSKGEGDSDCFKMLVVDDSFPVRKYLEEKLPSLITELDQSINFDIQFAVSGKQAVSKVKQAKGEYDIVLLDVMMEDINGYKVCKWIKKAKSSIAVIMLTSKKSTIDRVKANLSGCDGFLSKPPTDDDLKNVIKAHSKFQNNDINDLHKKIEGIST